MQSTVKEEEEKKIKAELKIHATMSHITNHMGIESNIINIFLTNCVLCVTCLEFICIRGKIK